ncbi:MAG TPA: beta-propeller domain-containing protein [Myxococcales bacterium]|jgi:hypothetical protein
MNRIRFACLAVLAALGLSSCTEYPAMTRAQGQTSFTSTAPAGSSYGRNAAPGSGDEMGAAADANGAGAKATAAPNRTVQETDIYRLEGDRLYYLNSYRGLMVFDVTNVDQPRFLGRSPIFGWPVDMIVRNGIATVVVADWYGQMEDGTPFHGSIVRGLDATNPADIKVLGEARLGGWVRDDRVVGDVIYAVSEDYGWSYGWGGSSTYQPSVIVSSVSFAGGHIQAVGKQEFKGYTGIFNVTVDSILLAHTLEPSNPNDYYNSGPPRTELVYLDISDPAGAIVRRGSSVVNGQVQGWGADNGRWNLDFADGRTAHVVACTGQHYWCDYQSGYLLSTVDFTSPDAPALRSQLSIPATGWGVAARFGAGRLYLSPEGWYGTYTATPFQVFDLTDAANPKPAGTLSIPGTVWNILPAPNLKLFALGEDWGNQGYGGQVSLKYLDVADPTNPKLLGTSNFGQGWAWTPAAGTFKAFTMDAAKGLVVLPFAGWDDQDATYNNGLQLIEFDDATTRTAGAAHTKGWVERGIFVKNRLVSLSDLALAVVDYSDRQNPTVVTSLTLARNVIAAQPGGATIAEISTDWWGNDLSTSEVRILPIGQADETTDVPGAITVTVPGQGARVFLNDHLAYIVTGVRVQGPCPTPNWGSTTCYGRQQQIQVVDLAGGNAVLRGTLKLPVDYWGWYGWWWDWCGWWGFWWYDWYMGPEVVQVGSDALAFRRWQPQWDANGSYLDSNSLLYVVDLSNADAPTLASTTITTDPTGWWGNMKVVGQTLYTSHYEWYQTSTNPQARSAVRYYVDRIDLSDRAHPVVGAKINVPGLLVGGFDNDPNQLIFIDYRWDEASSTAKDDFSVCRISGGLCELRSTLTLDGWAGRTIVSGTKAYVSTQTYDWNGNNGPQVKLHAIDLTNPWSPVDRVTSGPQGWGWLLAVEGDRAIVSSGWGLQGVDVYKLVDGQAPQFRQFVRTAGWWTNGVSRQGDDLFLASGYWGVQKVDLQ